MPVIQLHARYLVIVVKNLVISNAQTWIVYSNHYSTYITFASVTKPLFWSNYIGDK